MIRLSKSVTEHWWHRLYIVIMRPFAVISVLGLLFSILLGSYVVDVVLMGDKSLISNEEQIFKRCSRF